MIISKLISISGLNSVLMLVIEVLLVIAISLVRKSLQGALVFIPCIY
jgi:hypothetical protein